MGNIYEAGFLTQAHAADPVLPSVEEGLEALSTLADYAHIKLNHSPLPSQRLIDPAHLHKYMVHFQSRVLPSVARATFTDEPFFAAEHYGRYEDSICEWDDNIPHLKTLYAAFPDVTDALETIDLIMRHEAAWKEKVRQACSPAEIDQLHESNHETYVGKDIVLAHYVLKAS